MWCSAGDTSELSVISPKPLDCVGVAHHVSMAGQLTSGCGGKGCRGCGAHGGVTADAACAVSELCGNVAVNLNSGLKDVVLAGLAKARDAEFVCGQFIMKASDRVADMAEQGCSRAWWLCQCQ